MYIEVNGVQLYYEVHGYQKPPFIMLHGNGGSHEDFQVTARELSRNYSVYLIDSRGHGLSSPIEEYHYMDMMEDVAAFIKKMNLGQPPVYGFSDGGIVTLLLAIHHPECVSAIMISGVNTFPKGVTKACYNDACQRFYETGDPMVGMMVFEPDITKEQLKSVSVPVQLIVGEFDLIRRQHTYNIARFIPEGRLEIIPGEDHGSYACNSPILYRVLRPFLKDYGLWPPRPKKRRRYTD